MPALPDIMPRPVATMKAVSAGYSPEIRSYAIIMRVAAMKIMKYPDPVLRQACAPVTDFNDGLGKLLDDMLETMYLNEGIGLAAPQVANLQRVLVLDVSAQRNQPMELINPVILWGDGSVSSEEGCLSIPDYREFVKRSKKIGVTAQRRNGESYELEADDLLARCIQHEIDHLDGVCFVERLSRLKKQLFKRWYSKRGPFE
jgi:peptide deformylase